MIHYKAVRKDKTSHYDQTTKWKAGRWIIEPNADFSHEQPCGRGIHSSPTLLHAVSYQQGPSLYAEVEVPDKFEGTKNILGFDDTKTRAKAAKVIRWLGPQEIDDLAGFRLHEANNPIHPFLTKAGKVTPQVIAELEKWYSVRASVGDSVGDSVWASVRASVWDSVRASVRASVWDSVRASVRASVWDSVGDSVGDSVWDSVWDSVGDSVGASVWDSVRASVWASVWAYIGSMFPEITSWKYAKKLGPNPWQPLRNLWLAGFVPSFDGATWRLHAGKDAKIVYEWTPTKI